MEGQSRDQVALGKQVHMFAQPAGGPECMGTVVTALLVANKTMASITVIGAQKPGPGGPRRGSLGDSSRGSVLKFTRWGTLVCTVPDLHALLALSARS